MNNGFTLLIRMTRLYIQKADQHKQLPLKKAIAHKAMRSPLD